MSRFANIGFKDYKYIHQEIMLPDALKITFFILRTEEKVPFLLYTLNRIHKRNKIIVFTSTRYHVDYLLTLLQGEKTIKSYGIYGKMTMSERQTTLAAFRKGKQGVLVVTDVAARGLDIP